MRMAHVIDLIEWGLILRSIRIMRQRYSDERLLETEFGSSWIAPDVGGEA